MLHVPPISAAFVSGLAGAFWLVGMWYAAPAILGRERTLVARIAAVGALGVGLPFVLGLVGALYAWTLWVGLFALVIVRIRRHGARDRCGLDASPPWDLVILVCVLVAIAWPAAVRPLMDGDSLAYHLPNAASWVVHHSLWTTGTRYWWYPGGSELFASALFAVSGPAIVGFAGLVPALLIGLRIRSIAIASGNHPLLGTAIACALLASSVVAQQTISLQNDLWLAAYFLEALVASGPASLALCSLVKPYGFVFAIAACAIRRIDVVRAPLVWLAGLVPLGLWAMRDAFLYRSAIIPPASIWFPNTAGTSIAAHFPGSFSTLASASLSAGAGWAAFMTCGLVAIVFAREPFIRWAALVSFGLFLLVPFGYNNADAQLANGQSLRFALPFVAVGAAALCMLRGRFVYALVPLAILSCIFEIATVWNLFWNDALTRDVPYALTLAAVVAAAVLATRSWPLRSTIAVAAFVAACAWTAGLAGLHPAAYLADRYGSNGVPAGAFDAFRTSAAARVVVVDLPAGAASLLRPDVDAYDARAADACARARALHAALLVGLPAGARALACGRVVFQDGASGFVVQ